MSSAESVSVPDPVLILRAALADLADMHHRTIKGSRLHDPENVDWRDCPCGTCVLAKSALKMADSCVAPPPSSTINDPKHLAYHLRDEEVPVHVTIEDGHLVFEGTAFGGWRCKEPTIVVGPPFAPATTIEEACVPPNALRRNVPKPDGGDFHG